MTKLMSDDRQEFLVKCAEKAIELMNLSVEPNAALTKIAKDAELNTKEVALVSHAINNSKTLSVLANSKPEDKDKPFLITNADVVNRNLYEADPLVSSEAKKDEKAGDKKEDARAGQLVEKNKKEAAALSCNETESYMDAEPVDHSVMAREAFGHDQVQQIRVKTAFTIDPETGEASFKTIEEQKIGSDVSYREVGNPYHKLAHVRIQSEEASVMYTAARQEALDGIEKMSNEFRRTDAPKFETVEMHAKLAGVTDEILEVVYNMCELEKFGHKRCGEVKVAGTYSITQRQANLSIALQKIDTAWQKAANALAVRNILDEAHRTIEQQIHKHAAVKTDKPDASKEHGAAGMAGMAKDVGVQMNNLSQAVGTMPEQLIGADFHGKSKAIDLLQSATGDYSDKEGPKYDQNNPPTNVGFRAELSGADTRGKVDQLLQDDFIRQHPIQDVVSAYNRALSVSPNLGHAELASLVKQDLAAGGAVPLDTLLRTSTSHPPA